MFGFAAPVILMVIVAYNSINNTSSMVEDSLWLAHTHEVIADANELIKLIVDMETGERGFLITGEVVF